MEYNWDEIISNDYFEEEMIKNAADIGLWFGVDEPDYLLHNVLQFHPNQHDEVEVDEDGLIVSKDYSSKRMYQQYLLLINFFSLNLFSWIANRDLIKWLKADQDSPFLFRTRLLNVYYTYIVYKEHQPFNGSNTRQEALNPDKTRWNELEASFLSAYAKDKNIETMFALHTMGEARTAFRNTLANTSLTAMYENVIFESTEDFWDGFDYLDINSRFMREYLPKIKLGTVYKLFVTLFVMGQVYYDSLFSMHTSASHCFRRKDRRIEDTYARSRNNYKHFLNYLKRAMNILSTLTDKIVRGDVVNNDVIELTIAKLIDLPNFVEVGTTINMIDRIRRIMLDEAQLFIHHCTIMNEPIHITNILINYNWNTLDTKYLTVKNERKWGYSSIICVVPPEIILNICLNLSMNDILNLRFSCSSLNNSISIIQKHIKHIHFKYQKYYFEQDEETGFWRTSLGCKKHLISCRNCKRLACYTTVKARLFSKLTVSLRLIEGYIMYVCDDCMMYSLFRPDPNNYGTYIYMNLPTINGCYFPSDFCRNIRSGDSYLYRNLICIPSPKPFYDESVLDVSKCKDVAGILSQLSF